MTRIRLKRSINELAIFGNEPVFPKKLHIGKPNIGDKKRLSERINTVLESRWLTNQGPFVHEFEKRVEEYIGVRNCIAMCNGTIALEITIRALGLKGEVIVPSFTFIATAHSLQWQGITPVFCDIDPKTHKLDTEKIESLITPRTTGIVGVHTWGRSCYSEGLSEVAERKGLKLLFDAAHAFGCSYKGEMVGNFGEAEIFSFHATKFLNTFEGGAVVTNNDDLAEKVRLMKNFGFQGYDNVIYIGINGKMSEISAAMGITGMESIDTFIKTNYDNYKKYRSQLSDLKGIRLIEYDANEKSNYQYIVIEIDDEITGIHRNLVQKVLWAENILARRYFYPGCHRMEPYKSYFPYLKNFLPETDRLASKVLTLPTGTAITEPDIEKICTILRIIIKAPDQLNQAMAERGI